MIYRDIAQKAFMDYAGKYDASDPLIYSKIDHTMRVAGNAEQIAVSIGMDRDDTDFGWMLGLLHDFGRFEQVRRFGTFVDSHSVDHAELGADLLFKEKKISLFSESGFKEADHQIAETAIRQHNKLKLPEDLDERTRLFCELLRDADKTDIFRVIDEMPFEQRIGKSLGMLEEKDEASPECMECIRLHRCIPRAYVHSHFEGRLGHVCLAFELVFEESRRIALKQGHLKHLLAETDENGEQIWNDRETGQLRFLKDELEKYWGMAL
ncbi:MAG: HD domain-containing protein [Lachnospiraceae bacterium]|nr:HD domain-containing protein [Lachnospiraceae bacterium]